MRLFFLSENTVVILFEQEISHFVFERVSQLTKAIDARLSEFIVDIIPSYASIHIVFKLLKISSDSFELELNKVISALDSQEASKTSSKTIEIPVYYGPEVALDTDLVAEFGKVSIDDVIKIHSSAIYDVYAIGFAPGFAYLGNVDERIAMPRKETPRQKISHGSVGIANQQTAIYPSDSPGGWQIIGRTPLSLIDYSDDKLTRFDTGDKVKFTPIDRAKYIAMGGLL